MNSEGLACWYFRLNGFLTSQNYYIHDGSDGSGSSRTDIDVLGVRFPYKAEIIKNDADELERMADERIFEEKNKPYIIMAEVTTSACKLNKSWTDKAKKNIHDFLRVVGAFENKDSIIDGIADKIYNEGFFEDSSYCVSLFLIGKEIDLTWHSKYPKVPQKTWDEILEFIYSRFEKYDEYKHDHSHWDSIGDQLWRCYEINRSNKSNFKDEIIGCLE